MNMNAYVIIAEDDAFLRETLEEILREHGVRVNAVENGEEALAAIKKEKPNLLLLDILMPKVDGYAVLKEIGGGKASFPIVMLTNLSDELNQQKCRELGIRDYLVKSDLDEDELWPRISKYLGNT